MILINKTSVRGRILYETKREYWLYTKICTKSETIIILVIINSEYVFLFIVVYLGCI